MFRRKVLLAIVISFSTAFFICVWNLNGINQKDNSVFASDILDFGKKLYSQGKEELIIRDFFNDSKGGVFVDVGCADYMHRSTTYYLEKHLGWSGIAIDALAEYALGYIENRPNTRFFNFIVTDHSGNIEPFSRLIESPSLSSTKELRIIGKKRQVIYIPTITLTELLEKNGISKINFLSIDIEGGETAALAGFDIKRFKPELVCIEKSGGILHYFIQHDYELLTKYLKYDKINWYFKPRIK